MADVRFVDRIPVDILFDIFLRLPTKSIGRFVCVSKLWATIIRGEDFIRSFSFLSSSKKHPRFLLSFRNRIKGYQNTWHFFSTSTLLSTPPLCPPDFLSSTVCHLKKPRFIKPSYAHGLINFLYGDEQVVCNPTTGKSITLPTPTFESTEMIVRSFLGYDPIHARYKVLCLTNVRKFCEHQVLTLESSQTQTQNWRMINCSTPHCALGSSSVCIDGVLYYTASASFTRQKPFLARFDLRSETLEFVSMFPKGFGSDYLHEATLINYHGKVALVTRYRFCINAFGLWVLENVNKQEWSKQDVSFSHLDTREFHGDLELLGVSDMGEFISTPTEFEQLLYLYFLDHKSNKITSIRFQGSTNHDFRDFFRVFTFLDHVESLMFI